jgi:hypothetical protein
MAMLTKTKLVERRYYFTSVMMKGKDATAFLLVGPVYSAAAPKKMPLTLPSVKLKIMPS